MTNPVETLTYDPTDIPAMQTAVAKLNNHIVIAQNAQREDAMAKIKSLMNETGITVDQLRGSSKQQSRGKVAIKYKSPSTGETWTGRGKPPAWIAPYSKEERAQFEVSN